MAEPGQQRSKAELTADIRARRRTALVVNVRSRRGRRHYPTVCRQLHNAGLDLLDLHPVADPRRLAQALAAAVDSGADLIVVGGGDGTLSEATHQLAHRDLCLGVLPLGTTNNFARSLGLPLHLPAALQILTEGKVADVDLGHVAGRHFANLTSLGLSVQVAKHVPHQLKRILGRADHRHQDRRHREAVSCSRNSPIASPPGVLHSPSSGRSVIAGVAGAERAAAEQVTATRQDAAREQAELRAGLEAQTAAAEETRTGLVTRAEHAEAETGQARSAVAEADARLAEALAGKAAAEQKVAAAESRAGEAERAATEQVTAREQAELRADETGQAAARTREPAESANAEHAEAELRRADADRDNSARPAARQQPKGTTRRSRRSRG